MSVTHSKKVAISSAYVILKFYGNFGGNPPVWEGACRSTTQTFPHFLLKNLRFSLFYLHISKILCNFAPQNLLEGKCSVI